MANFSCHKLPTFLVIQLFQIFIYFYTFYTSIPNITPHRPDDGPAEPKRDSVDFISL